LINNHSLVTGSYSLVMWMKPSRISTEARIRHSFPEATSTWLLRGDIGDKVRVLSNLMEKFIRPQDGFASEPIPLEASDRFRRLENLLSLLPAYTKSDWYKSLKIEIGSNGFASHKHYAFRDLDSLDEFFENYLLPLFESLQENGFEQSLSPDVPRGIIWSDGRISKSVHGNHRFIVAKLLGVPEIPIELDAIHRDWWDSEIGGRITPEKLLEAGNHFSDRVTLTRR